MSEINKTPVEKSTEEKKKKRSFKEILSPITIVGIVLGSVAGYLYYVYVGCRSGSCPLNSNPFITTLWGAVLGYLVSDIFRIRKKPTSGA